MTGITRRQALATGIKLTGLAGMAAVVEACGGSSTGSSSSAAKSTTDPNGTITVWQHQSEAYNKVYKQLAAQYMQRYPKVKIQDLFIPYAQFEAKVLTAFTGGKPPDVVKMGGWSFANYASKNLFAAMAADQTATDALKGKYAPGGLDALTFDGKVYGLPIDFNSVFFYYRKDHLQQAGLDPEKPPTTWEQVLDYAKELTVTAPSGQLKRAGFQYWYGIPIWDMLNFLPLVLGEGGTLLSEDGTSGTLSSPAGVKAIEWFAGLSTAAKVASPQFTDPNFNYGQLAKGTASMTVSANFAAALVESLSGNKLKLGENFGVAKMPQWAAAAKPVTSGYSWGWAVARKSANAATARHFLDFLQASQAVDAQLSAAGLVTPIQSWQTQPTAADSPGAQIMAEQLPYTNFGPAIPQWNEMAKALSDNLVAAAQGKKAPDQAAKDFDSAMRDVLG